VYSQSTALELAYVAVEEAIRLGAIYADARFEVSTREELRTLGGNLVRASYDVDRGLGLRVLARGAWGFVAVAEPTRHDAVIAARRAVAAARASAVLRERPVEMIESEAHRGLHRTLVERDPFSVPLEDKLGLLLHLDERARRPAEVVMARTRYLAERRHKVLVTSEGAEVEQDLTCIDVGLQAGASDGRRLQVVSFPDGVVSAMSSRGWEFVDLLELEHVAEGLGDAAVEQLAAESLPAEPRALILSPRVMAAHALGMEPLFRLERTLAGDSAWSGPGLLGSSIASEDLEIVMHPGWSGGAGTYGYDDEGVPAQPLVLVDQGRVVASLCSRAGAARVGLDHSTGSLRSGSWASRPDVFAGNLVVSGGPVESVDRMIEDTENGVYVESLASLSSSGRDGEFVAVAERAWEIRDGRRVRPLDHPAYRGRATEFFRGIDAVGALPSSVMLGVERSPGLPVGVSAPAIRIRGVEVGRAPEPPEAKGRLTSSAVLPPRRIPRRRAFRNVPRRDRF